MLLTARSFWVKIKVSANTISFDRRLLDWTAIVDVECWSLLTLSLNAIAYELVQVLYDFSNKLDCDSKSGENQTQQQIRYGKSNLQLRFDLHFKMSDIHLNHFAVHTADRIQWCCSQLFRWSMRLSASISWWSEPDFKPCTQIVNSYSQGLGSDRIWYASCTRQKNLTMQKTFKLFTLPVSMYIYKFPFNPCNIQRSSWDRRAKARCLNRVGKHEVRLSLGLQSLRSCLHNLFVLWLPLQTSTTSTNQECK